MLFTKFFPNSELRHFYIKQFGRKALEYYKRMGEGSDLQQKYAEQKKVEDFLINTSQP